MCEVRSGRCVVGEMRLIDADALWEKISQAQPNDALALIEDAPTVDAVEVVRCKDCEFKDGDVCDYSAVYVHPNGFCNWGKRREE